MWARWPRCCDFKLPVLKTLGIARCGTSIDDEGVASLVKDLSKDDFKALEKLHLDENRLTNQGCTLLVSTLDSGAMPKLAEIRVVPNLHASSAATVAVALALERREG